MSGKGYAVKRHNKSVEWHLLGHSQIGVTHQRAGKSNQDAMKLSTAIGSATPSPLIVAIADGHGSARYPRSQRGAELAVRCAIQLLAEMLESTSETTASHSFIKNTAEQQLPKKLFQRWVDEVTKDAQGDPPEDNDADTVRLYGTTLLAMAVTETFIIFLQIGDGDFRIVTDESQVNLPFVRDEMLLGNETYSLAQKEAWKHIRVHFQMIGERPPALIMLSTDGYSNSFVSPQDFDQVGTDLLAMLRQEGVTAIEAKLPEWLAQASSAGSGDDVTVVLVYREELSSVESIEPATGNRGEGDADPTNNESADLASSQDADPMSAENQTPSVEERRAEQLPATADTAEVTSQDSTATEKSTNTESIA